MSEISDKIEALSIENVNFEEQISELKAFKIGNIKKIRSLEEAQKTLNE